MRLTVQGDYALRLLMHLAVQGDALVTIPEIAGRYAISRNHLMKVANSLGRAGFIETVRGRSGGLRLARPASEISAGAVLRRLERRSALVECFPGGRDACLITPCCNLKGALAQAQEAFFSVLEGFTIADLVSNNPALHKLLGRNAA